jgi:hypothetical protein
MQNYRPTHVIASLTQPEKPPKKHAPKREKVVTNISRILKKKNFLHRKFVKKKTKKLDIQEYAAVKRRKDQ